MDSMTSIAFLLLLGGLSWFWFDTLRTREIAAAICARACRQFEVQLLDQTIALDSIRLLRVDKGRLCFQRRYRFDFSADGDSRRQGTLLMSGTSPAFLELPGYERVILPV
ncbi:MAG: DUF3301 domain-containing protein [Gammaproteobacteria bacterium]|nr:DUF3301 domain-containing protein [Gammaproteobacteria bacterium]